MDPLAFYVNIIILAVSIPAIVWAYISLRSAFMCHAPTSLAGTYAVIYAGSAIEDVAGTENISSKEIARRLEIGN